MSPHAALNFTRLLAYPSKWTQNPVKDLAHVSRPAPQERQGIVNRRCERANAIAIMAHKPSSQQEYPHFYPKFI